MGEEINRITAKKTDVDSQSKDTQTSKGEGGGGNGKKYVMKGKEKLQFLLVCALYA
jgi:hypothetical protein